MPTAPSIPPSLENLVNYLDGLTGRAPLATLRDMLGSSPVTYADIEPFVRFRDECYQRVGLCSGEFYEMLVVCWKSGQMSPIHDHANSTCCFRVMKGVCTETVFGFDAGGQVVEKERRDLPEGHLAVSHDRDTHQVSNLQSHGQGLVTLHIYSPPLQAMRKYSITGERVGDFEPDVMRYGEDS